MPTYQSQFCFNPSLRRSRVLLGALLISIALAAAALGFPHAAQAATITVNTTADEFNTGPGCSLREAIQAANTDTAFGGCAAGAGADTITLASGTYQITINPGPDENANAAGDFDIASSLTLQGAGAGSTFVDGRGLDRVFDVAPNGGPAITVAFSGLTLQNGKGLGTNFGAGGGMFINSNATVSISNSTLANNQSTTTVGGAIANRGTLTLNTVTLQNNTALSLGGAVSSAASGGGGGLTVINSTFTGNRAESGGALYISTDAGTNASITGGTFTGNQAVATAGGTSDDGGAIAVDTDGAVDITKSTFTGNSAAANGGAIFFKDSATQTAVATLTMSYNRIAGNTANGGSGLYRASGTATAQKNWWGCNGGPAAAPCNLVAGAASFTPWIVLTHTASPTTINTGQAATLTAGFLQELRRLGQHRRQPGCPGRRAGHLRQRRARHDLGRTDRHPGQRRRHRHLHGRRVTGRRQRRRHCGRRHGHGQSHDQPAAVHDRHIDHPQRRQSHQHHHRDLVSCLWRPSHRLDRRQLQPGAAARRR